MSENDDRLEKVSRFLWERGAFFILAYCEKDREVDHDLKWTLAWSQLLKTREDRENLATQYYELATHCYHHKRNKLLQRKKAGQSERRWGLNVPTGNLTPYPPNHLGQFRWLLAIGSGATHAAGYVIVAEIAAKERQELITYIANVQYIISH
jgi:hypothetical protein